MKMNYLKNTFTLALVTLAMSCADDEKLRSPSESNEIIPDVVLSTSNTDNAKVDVVPITRFSGFFGRNAQATTGSIRFKIYEGNSADPLRISGPFSVNQFSIKGGQNPPTEVFFPLGLNLKTSIAHRVEVECLNCNGEVYWWRSTGNPYVNGTVQWYNANNQTWVNTGNDFSFKVYNENSDGTEYVSRVQGEKTNTFTLNAGIRYAQTFIPEIGGDYIISFPDETLEEKVRSLAGLDSNVPIRYRNVQSITSLDVFDVSFLQGIQYLDNLQTLVLVTDNNVNLTPLKGLARLKSLTLHGKNITNITPLGTLTGLTYLLISNDQIASIAALQPLTKLTDLTLYTKKLTAVGVLTVMAPTLKRLILESDELTNVSSFSTLSKLERLELRTHILTNIQSFSGLTNLTYLRLFANNDGNVVSNLTNINSLSPLTKLTYLEIEDTKVSTLIPLATLVNLTDLMLSNNRITEVPPLEHLSNLNTLNLSTNDLANLDNLDLLTSLDNLYLSGNSRITQQMVNTLKQDLPDTNIVF